MATNDFVFNDDFCEKHLDAWLESRVRPKNLQKAKKAMKDFIIEHNIQLADNRSWPEILQLAIRNDYIKNEEIYL